MTRNGKVLFLWLLIFGFALAMLALPSATHRVAADNVLSSDNFTTGQRVADRVRISVDQIPAMTAPMPVLRLAKQAPPDAFVRRFLANVAPQAKTLEPLGKNKLFAQGNLRPPDNLYGAFDGNHLAAYVDNQSGDAQVFPAMSRLKPMRQDELERAGVIARQSFAREQLLGKDDTRFELLKPLALYGQNTTRSGSQGKSLFLAYVRLRRFVDKYPVYGPGSRALLVIGSGGSFPGFVRRWKTGETVDRVWQARSRAEVT